MAIGTPSSGREAHRRVDRAAVAHGRHRAAAAEMADDERVGAEPARDARLRRRGRGSRSGGCPSLAPARAGSRRSPPPPGSSRGTRCRRPRRAARPAAPRAPRRSPRAPARCAAARVDERSQLAPRPRRRRRPARGSARRRARRGGRPPPTPRRLVERVDGVDRSSSSTSWSLRLVEPALTTRTRVSTARSSRGSSGSSSPCSRV